VPYKSTTDAQVDMLAGRVHVWFTTLASAVPVVKDGRVRILGVTGAQRNSLLPEVPTMAEAGYPDLDMDASFYILLPAGVPQPILNRLSADILHAQDSKAVKDRFAFQGIVSRTGSPVETRRALNNEFDKMNKIIKALSAKPS
jgi:tripartite-type tricarboxylate transporter receptor subunit TctC